MRAGKLVAKSNLFFLFIQSLSIPRRHNMCDPLGVIGFVTGTVSSIALAAHVRKNLQNIKHELVQQEADVEILSLIVSEAERAFISHGRPSEAIRLAMEVCIQRKVNCEKSISWLQEIQALTDEGAKLSPLQRIKKVKVAFFDSHKRNQAFQSFRDSVLLLRDLSDRYVAWSLRGCEFLTF